jgi:hypothetical protein
MFLVNGLRRYGEQPSPHIRPLYLRPAGYDAETDLDISTDGKCLIIKPVQKNTKKNIGSAGLSY